MIPRCQTCGSGSCSESTDQREVDRFAVARVWVCANGHEFSTVEVPPSFLCGQRARCEAERALRRRVSRYHRNIVIKNQHNALHLSVYELARIHGLTPTRIAQILKM